MKTAKNIILALKVVILFASFGFIALKLIHEKQIDELIRVIREFDRQKSFFLFLVFVLMGFNWFSESYKWKLVISKLQNINVFSAFLAILSGITISLFTPNRTGEFAGRILSLNKANRISAVFSTFTGNIAQLLTTIAFGLIAIAILPFQYKGVFIDSLYTPKWISIVSVFILGIFVLAYFNLKFFKKPLHQIKFLNRYRLYYECFFDYSKRQLFYFLILSIIRYTIYTVQFVLLLAVFNVNLEIMEYLTVIFIIFLVLTAIPTVALSEIGVRGSIAIFLIAQLSDNLSGVFMASTSLWIINLAIPALVGSVIIYRSKI